MTAEPPQKMTKVVCTIGPASRNPQTLSHMLAAGMNVVRLNMAHGTIEQHAIDDKTVRGAANRAGCTVAVMADLAGPKIRVGRISGDVVQLREGSAFMLTTRDITGDETAVSVTYNNLPQDLDCGDRVLLADGSIELRVISVSGSDVECSVIDGGPLSSHKGVNLPTVTISAPAMTDKDLDDLPRVIGMDVDFLALSFVKSAEDVKQAKQILKRAGADIPIIAKIERHEALENIDSIIRETAGIMVARGDLGVETPLENIAIVQKDLIRRANIAGKPVITATQMLRSMVDEPMPTRAEATDVANAVLDGTDAVMLSEETAVGRYPVQTCKYISRISMSAEAVMQARVNRLPPTRDVEGALSHAAVTVASEVGAAVIVTPTRAGTTPSIISRFRSPHPIIAVTPDDRVQRRLQLTWGVTPVKCEEFKDTDQMLAEGERAALESGLVRAGQLAVFITVARAKSRSAVTNILKVKPVG